MELTELCYRLNDGGYKNWLKAGRCLVILKEGLHPFTDRHMRDFHGFLLHHNAVLHNTCGTSCRPRANKLPSLCTACSEWQKVILKHHREPGATIHWNNCFPPDWRTHHWELAKAYMPRGQAKVQRADQCDAAALLNLIHFCKGFHSVDPTLVREVIRFRNELMHSSDLRMTDKWMSHFQNTVKLFVEQLSSVPQIEAVGRQIDEMLNLDLSICVYGEDHLDSSGLLDKVVYESASQSQPNADLIIQWEAELLQETLQEFLHTSAADGDDEEEDTAKTLDTGRLKQLGGFLESSKDLGERFSTELQVINSLDEAV
ncbi:uncharacterized protein CXorf38 homolog isoform X2 [Gouania willdenowi]|uniref:DZIP3-like HEPN domain-containing protein n=1 Tax=Gouania willdenowi TaxID=441366 RepID=A0A8C5I1C3_GOUWI|nr:uncharacterized protein CXorf38 homolog isoform X2 [Gouania willdenowi]